MFETIDQAEAFGRAYQRVMELARTDAQVAAAVPDPAVFAAMREPGLSYPEVIARALAGYAGRPALGTRSYELRAGDDGRVRRHCLPAFDTITYAELARRVEAIACAWRDHPRHAVAPGEFGCFIAFTGAEMVTADLACAYAHVNAVPLQANLPTGDMMGVFADTAPAVLIATIGNLELAAGYAEQVPSVRSLIVLDHEPCDDDECELFDRVARRLADGGGRIALASLAELVEYGTEREWRPLPRRAEGGDAMVMLMYTSGSTGTPKGAIIHDAMCSEIWTTAPAMPMIQLIYAPFNHFMGRTGVYGVLGAGGVAHFTLKGDMSTLFEDIRLTRPTFLMLMPRVAEIIFQQYQSEVQRRVAAGEAPAEADSAVRREMATATIGDRVVAGGVGSAPTAPAVRQFLRDCFDIALSNGYSSTEASSTAILSGGTVQRGVVTDYKLIDVPELGYFTTDKPYPRGELLLKSRLAIQGYFKRPEATAAIFDAEGWLHTGDIMAELEPDRLEWLDRRNNVIKLSQAEYVAIGPLEATLLGGSKLIRQIYVYGSSYRSYLLAVAVPDMGIARARLGRDPSPVELRAMILADVREAANQADLKSFEIPRDVIVEPEPFTHENGLLSSVRKPLRPKLKERYQDALEALYEEIDRKQQAELAQLRERDSGLSTAERVAVALKAALGLAELDAASPQTYGELGGDSLGAVSVSLLLEEIFGVEVPVSVILSPTATVQRLARYLDSQRDDTGSGQRPSMAAVHGENPDVLRASDLALDAFLDADALRDAAVAEPPAREADTVLITGATGFLGRFLCLEWMEHFTRKGRGKVICIVRAANGEQAFERLRYGLCGTDPELDVRFASLVRDHLEVVAGDLGAPRLGLDADTFARLAGEVDQIVHSGALVNHMLSYRDLFGPNVLGTAELLRLALSRRLKRFDYVSTFGVPQMHRGLASTAEDADVRSGAPEMPLGEGYAQGYGLSKWASEVLLREANEHFGLPVTVYRPDMILAHSRYHGQINVPDMFTRLLFSLAMTGLAPISFYRRPAGGGRARAHYDGLPVDFLAAAIQQLGSTPNSGFRTFNTTSTGRDDGISLDTITDWVESAGYPLTRVDDHAAWVRLIEERMRALPPEERQHSSLPILSHFAVPHSPDSTRIRNDAFVAAVRSIPAGPEVPGIGEAFIHKYLGDMQLLGLMARPN